ncbi:MAG: hypothetical protein M0D57_16565 [Sphingobacteriales bacterium JAD_PAG50586_3]|nr:MAG: hypothetical protein M0D57_16565 [Sphingobacteriales bacterium JAD_PAG50586_3]
MINENISTILYIVGPVTGIVSLQFFFPSFYANKILNIELKDDAAKFYFAHWGILVAALAILMVLAADNVALRTPVISVTLMEKALLVFWVLKDIKKPYTKKLLPAVVFDSAVSIVFSLYLLGM